MTNYLKSGKFLFKAHDFIDCNQRLASSLIGPEIM